MVPVVAPQDHPTKKNQSHARHSWGWLDSLDCCFVPNRDICWLPRAIILNLIKLACDSNWQSYSQYKQGMMHLHGCISDYIRSGKHNKLAQNAIHFRLQYDSDWILEKTFVTIRHNSSIRSRCFKNKAILFLQFRHDDFKRNNIWKLKLARRLPKTFLSWIFWHPSIQFQIRLKMFMVLNTPWVLDNYKILFSSCVVQPAPPVFVGAFG